MSALKQTTFREMLAHLGALKIVEPIVDFSYLETLKAEWHSDEPASPHGRPWHVSFHASQFPGDSEQACGRLAMYGFMDIPRKEPISRWLDMTAEAGKSIELQQVRRVRDAGFLARSNQPHSSTDPDKLDEHGRQMPQIGFIDHEHWLTGSVDMPIIQFGSEALCIVEVKTKNSAHIDAMIAGERKFDARHRNQVLCSLGLAHENPGAFLHPTKDEVLDPPTDGVIFYIARDSEWNPRNEVKTHEFYFEYDSGFMEQGRAHLKKWKEAYLSDELPQTVAFRNKRSHPFGWKWSEGICKMCDLKKICRADYESRTTRISESNAIEYAKSIRPAYDPEAKRKAVFSMWRIEE